MSLRGSCRKENVPCYCRFLCAVVPACRVLLFVAFLMFRNIGHPQKIPSLFSLDGLLRMFSVPEHKESDKKKNSTSRKYWAYKSSSAKYDFLIINSMRSVKHHVRNPKNYWNLLFGPKDYWKSLSGPKKMLLGLAMVIPVLCAGCCNNALTFFEQKEGSKI